MPRDLFADEPERRQPRDLLAGMDDTPQPPTNPPSLPVPGATPDQGGGFLRTIDDAVRGVADVATFGFADEFAAKMAELTGIGSAGGDYDANLAAERKRDEEGGAARFGGQVAGSLLIPSGAAKTVAGAAATGASMGAAYGFGSGEDGFENRRDNAVLGGAIGGIGGAAVQGVVNKLAGRAASASIPSNDQLRELGDAAYKAADDAGVIIKPSGMQKLAATINEDLAEFGYDPALQPGIAAVVNRLGANADQNVTLKGLDVIRRVAGEAGKVDLNQSQKALAGRVIDRIDNFIDDLPAEDVLTGNADQGAAALSEARGIWSRLRKSERLDRALQKGEDRAGSTGSGGNVDNAIRQEVRKTFLDKPRGVTKAEEAAARKVIRDTPVQKAARTIGKLSPQGNGLMTALGVGGAMANPVFGIPSLAGIGAKALADSTTRNKVDTLSAIIRSGGKTPEQMIAAARRGEGPRGLLDAIAALDGKGQRALPSISLLGAILADKVSR